MNSQLKLDKLKKNVMKNDIIKNVNDKHPKLKSKKPINKRVKTVITEKEIAVTTYDKLELTKHNRKKKIKDTISSLAKQALDRGGGKACVATHSGGCRHYGILDLQAMDSKNYLFYTKPGGWLNGKSCIDCQLCINKMLLDKCTKTYLQYFDMGLKGIKFNRHGDADKQNSYNDHHCETILCISCWNKKVNNFENTVSTSVNGDQLKRRSARNKS